MDNQKAKMLGENLAHYKRMQENGTVDIIEFHTTDGQKFGIGNVAAIQLLLSVAVTELERQLHTARFGDIPERLEESREYKTARKLEQALNDMGFNPERFAETLPYFHKTLEQAFFRVMKACIIGMAKAYDNQQLCGTARNGEKDIQTEGIQPDDTPGGGTHGGHAEHFVGIFSAGERKGRGQSGSVQAAYRHRDAGSGFHAASGGQEPLPEYGEFKGQGGHRGQETDCPDRS